MEMVIKMKVVTRPMLKQVVRVGPLKWDGSFWRTSTGSPVKPLAWVDGRAIGEADEVLLLTPMAAGWRLFWPLDGASARRAQDHVEQLFV